MKGLIRFDFILAHFPFIIGVLINLIIVYVFVKFVDLLARKVAKNLRMKNSENPLLNLMPILTKIIKIIGVFVLLAGFLDNFGYNINSLIAGFGITGLAVGFAAKEAIGNIFGSIGLLADRVYKIGEYIKFQDIEGVVENINLRSTTLRTLDGFVVNIPNNLLANDPITNVSLNNKRKIDIAVDIEYSTSNDKIESALNILKDIAESNQKIYDGAISCIEELAPSSISLRLFCYTEEQSWIKYKEVKSQIVFEIIKRFRAENINFAFPSTNLYIEKN